MHTIAVTSVFWAVRGKSLEICASNLRKAKKEELVALAINTRMNDFCVRHSDDKTVPFGKRIPYIGWFWRTVDFYHKKISIGKALSLVGFIENNKWDYPERYLTDKEANKVIAMLWSAMEISQRGGNLGETTNAVNVELEKLWNYMQRLKI